MLTALSRAAPVGAAGSNPFAVSIRLLPTPASPALLKSSAQTNTAKIWLRRRGALA